MWLVSREAVDFEKWVLYHAKSLRVGGIFLCSIFGSGLLVITDGAKKSRAFLGHNCCPIFFSTC